MQIYEKKSVCQKNIEKLSQKNDRYLFFSHLTTKNPYETVDILLKIRNVVKFMMTESYILLQIVLTIKKG